MIYNEYLEHHGIKGMHWGIRRYQNPDGSLTPAGRKRYGYREKDIKDLERQNTQYRRSIAESKRQLEDLNKNGYNSKTWKDAWGYDSTSGDDAYQLLGYSSKKDALDSLKNSTRIGIDDYNEWIQNNNKLINSIKSTPLDKSSYTEKVRAGQNAAKAIMASGTLLSTGLALYGYNKWTDSGKTAVKSALVGALGSAVVAANVYAERKTRAYDEGYKYESRPFATQKEISKITSELASDAQLLRKMEKMRAQGASERQISEAWDKEVDRRVDRYLESKM